MTIIKLATVPEGAMVGGATGPYPVPGSIFPAGSPGSPGPANTLAIGTVTTLSPGALATASIGGTSPAQTLNLGIPAGAPGAPGSSNASSLTGVLGAANGGTGVNNGSATISLGGSLTTTGSVGATLAFGASGDTYTFPDSSDTVVLLGQAQTLTSKTINGVSNTLTNIGNASLANSTISGAPLGGNLAALTIGTHLTGSSYNGSGAVAIATDATSANAVSTIIARDGNGNASVSDPTSATHIATKNYVDAVAQSLSTKASVLCATTANITLSGEQTVDGQATSASRVLVKNQTTASQNGIYVSASGAWTRSVDCSTWAELVGAFTFVEQGNANGTTGWACSVAPGGTIGTTAVTFTQFSGAGTYVNGSGLNLSGTVFSLANPGPSALGGVQSFAGVANQFLTGISTSGVPQAAQPSFSNLSGTINGSQIASSTVTNSMLANMATNTIKANITGSSAAPVDSTLSAILDAEIGSTRGSLMVRGSSGWTALSTTTTGYTVQYNGADTVFSAPVPGTGAVRYDAAQSLTAGQQVQGAANINLVATPIGQCRLAYVSSTSISLSPKDGNQLWVNGAYRTIPSGGVALANTGLTAATAYYVYAFMSGSTLTLEASTTGHATDATYGHEIKSGDGTRTLVGWVNMASGSPGTFADSGTQRFVKSWFNRPAMALLGASSNQTSGATSTTEISTSYRVNFGVWPDELVQLNVTGQAIPGQTGTTVYTALNIDGSAVGTPTAFTSPSGNAYAGSASVSIATTLSEGLHYASINGFITSGATVVGTWAGLQLNGAIH